MLGPCGPVDVVEMLGPCGPLVCWCGYPCRRRNRIRPTGRHHRWRMCHRGTCIRYGHSGPGARLGGVCRCAPGFRRPGFRPGLWSTGPTARPGPSIRALRPGWGGVCDTPLHRYVHSPLGRGRFTALPKAGTPGGMLWASSRRPTRGERRRRRGLRAARSAGC